MHFLPAQGGRGREVIHPLLRPSYFQLLLSGGSTALATGRRREAQLLPTNNQDLSCLERDGDNGIKLQNVYYSCLQALKLNLKDNVGKEINHILL